MQTIKTAIVVVLLLGVCYGAYVALNAPEPVLPPELDQWAADGGLDISVEDGAAISIPQLSMPTGGNDLANLAPPNVDTTTGSDVDSIKEPQLSLPSSSIPAPTLPLANSSTLPSTPSLALPGAGQGDAGATKNNLGNPALPGNDKLASNLASNASSTLPKLPELGTLPSLDLPPGVEGTSMPLGGNVTPSTTAPSATASTGSTSTGSTSTTAPLPASGTLTSAPADGPLPALPGMPALPGSTSTDPIPAAPAVDRMVSFAQPAGGSAASSSAAAGSTPGNALPNPTNNSAGSGASKGDAPVQPFSVARAQAIKLANDGKLRDALAMISPYYNHIELTHEEHLDLIDLLDALAAEVVYSKRHLLEPPFIVSAGETLESIANKYQISPETLSSINRMGDSKIVLAGMQMKVVRGPFRGEVNLTRGELTLFLGNLYAGRFPISVGKDQKPSEGEYKLIDRRRDRSYVGKDSKYYAANDPLNPYGGYWMHLGNDISIHGSAATQSPELENAGCISLAPLDARDVYNLLTAGSPITIKR